jgi:hypothetical protein
MISSATTLGPQSIEDAKYRRLSRPRFLGIFALGLFLREMIDGHPGMKRQNSPAVQLQLLLIGPAGISAPSQLLARVVLAIYVCSKFGSGIV